MNKHRPNVDEGFLTKHELKLVNLTSENAKRIHAEIDALLGVDGVWIDVKKSTIKIAYEASHHRNIDEMAEIIRKHGADVSTGWWNQLKLGWHRQIDHNIHDNAQHKPLSCHKPRDEQ